MWTILQDLGTVRKPYKGPGIPGIRAPVWYRVDIRICFKRA